MAKVAFMGRVGEQQYVLTYGVHHVTHCRYGCGCGCTKYPVPCTLYENVILQLYDLQAAQLSLGQSMHSCTVTRLGARLTGLASADVRKDASCMRPCCTPSS